MMDFVIGLFTGMMPVLMGAGAYFMSYAFIGNEQVRLLIGALVCVTSLLFM